MSDEKIAEIEERLNKAYDMIATLNKAVHALDVDRRAQKKRIDDLEAFVESRLGVCR